MFAPQPHVTFERRLNTTVQILLHSHQNDLSGGMGQRCLASPTPDGDDLCAVRLQSHDKTYHAHLFATHSLYGQCAIRSVRDGNHSLLVFTDGSACLALHIDKTHTKDKTSSALFFLPVLRIQNLKNRFHWDRRSHATQVACLKQALSLLLSPEAQTLTKRLQDRFFPTPSTPHAEINLQGKLFLDTLHARLKTLPKSFQARLDSPLGLLMMAQAAKPDGTLSKPVFFPHLHRSFTNRPLIFSPKPDIDAAFLALDKRLQRLFVQSGCLFVSHTPPNRWTPLHRFDLREKVFRHRPDRNPHKPQDPLTRHAQIHIVKGVTERVEAMVPS